MSHNIEPTEHYLTRKQAAHYVTKVLGLPLSPMTLATYASTGPGPLYFKIGRRCFYEIRDLIAWVEARRTRKFKSTSDEGLNRVVTQ